MFWIKNLHLSQFRRFQEKDLVFSPGINLLYGANAVGKTTVLEAVSCLSLCQSFKTVKESELIHYGETYCFAKGTVADEDGEHELVFSVSPEGKRIKKDQQAYKNLSDYLGYFKLVIFSPQDLELVQGNPSCRRKFMDMALAQTDQAYLRTLISYKKWLRARNELLKGNPDKMDRELLTVITQKMIPLALSVTHKRRELVTRLNPLLKNSLGMLKEGEEASLIYQPDIQDEEHLDYYYESTVERDIAMQSTRIGPQRDDCGMLLSGHQASSYASQGQQRSLVLALKASLSSLFAEKNDHVVIAFDDVFSELDEERQDAVISLLGTGAQVFLTTTQQDIVSRFESRSGTCIKMEEREEKNG